MSMGIGNFFGCMPEELSDSRLYGVELDSISGRIAKLLCPNAGIEIKGFEDTDFRTIFSMWSSAMWRRKLKYFAHY